VAVAEGDDFLEDAPVVAVDPPVVPLTEPAVADAALCLAEAVVDDPLVAVDPPVEPLIADRLILPTALVELDVGLGVGAEADCVAAGFDEPSSVETSALLDAVVSALPPLMLRVSALTAIAPAAVPRTPTKERAATKYDFMFITVKNSN